MKICRDKMDHQILAENVKLKIESVNLSFLHHQSNCGFDYVEVLEICEKLLLLLK